MLNKLKNLFKSNGKDSAEQQFLNANNIIWDDEKGFIVDDIVLNEALSARLEYLSNRRLKTFDDLKELYFAAMLMNEKIDLEIVNQSFVARLDNTEENLLQFKSIVQKLNQYYRDFKREKR